MMHIYRGKKINVCFQLIVENLEFSKLFRKIATAGDFVDFSSYLEKTLSRCQFSSTQGKELLTNYYTLLKYYKKLYIFLIK